MAGPNVNNGNRISQLTFELLHFCFLTGLFFFFHTWNRLNENLQ